MFGGSAAIIAGGLYAYNPYVGGNVYQIPIETAYSKLVDMEMPSSMGVGNYRPGGGVETDVEENKSVTWKIRENGDIVARLSAELSPMGPKATNVRVTFQFDPESKQAKRSPRLAQSRFIADMAKFTIDEQVDATLTDREYDSQRVGAKILAYMLTNRSALQEFMGDIEAEMASVSEMAGQSYGGGSGVAQARIQEGGTGPQMSTRATVNVEKYNR